MPVVGLRNADAQQIGSVDHLDVEDRNFGAEWYDSAGGTAFIGAITVPLATTRHNSAPEFYDMSSGILTVAEAGLYLLNFCVAVFKAGTSEGSFQAFLEEDADVGSFSLLPATTSYATTFSSSASVYNSVLLQVGINYRYRLRTATHGVVFTTVADGSKLSVIRLFKNG
jgi:hypothetical protein